MTDKREELVYMAKICEQTERYPEMLEYLRKILEHPQTSALSIEDRNLLSVAYKNSVGTKRTSWRILETLERKEETKKQSPESENHLKIIRKFKKQVEGELNQLCEEIIKMLDDKLIPTSDDNSSKVFYLKMKGDYYRYVAEYVNPEKREEVAKKAFEAYSKAEEIAQK